MSLMASPYRPSPMGSAVVGDGLIYRRGMSQHALDGNRLATSRAGEQWVASLRSSGPARERAMAELHGLLLRAARFELSRRRTTLSYVRGEELEDIATQAADDALMAVLAKLDDFRGA